MKEQDLYNNKSKYLEMMSEDDDNGETGGGGGSGVTVPGGWANIRWYCSLHRCIASWSHVGINVWRRQGIALDCHTQALRTTLLTLLLPSPVGLPTFTKRRAVDH